MTELSPIVYGLPGVTEMVELMKEIVGWSPYIYQRSRYERGRARDIAEMRGDWGDFCAKHNITADKLRVSVEWIVRTSHIKHKKFERLRITNCDTFWRNWANVYNIAVDMKSAQDPSYMQSGKQPLSIKASI